MGGTAFQVCTGIALPPTPYPHAAAADAAAVAAATLPATCHRQNLHGLLQWWVPLCWSCRVVGLLSRP
eukprot:1140267-Pelagomonas_calceolata.AAC.6